MAVQFSYDGQIRRFVIQFIRMVSNFQVEFGKNSDGTRTLQTVPVYYGDVSRQAAMILRNNSENSLNTVPAMAAYISALTYDQNRLQNPYHEGTIRIRERTIDQDTGAYTDGNNGLYTVDRLMPAPYNMTIKLDIWTSNTEQKHQLIEQILPLFNPGLEIQNSDNFVDWTSLSVVLLKDVSYTSRTIPMMQDENIDVATLTFEVPIWLTLPAKVKKGGVVAEIVASIYAPDSPHGAAAGDGWLHESVVSTLNGLMSQQKFTPMNYELVYIGNTLTLYQESAYEGEHDDRLEKETHGTKVRWKDLANLYGTFTNGISQVRLTFESPTGPHQIVGTVAINPTDETQLLYTPDPATLPANTLDPVDAIIDPMTVNVDQLHILSPSVGTRYLILNPIGTADVDSEAAVAWAGAGDRLVAKANDIIEWMGNHWQVSFDSHTTKTVQYISNLTTTVQYCWTGNMWVKSYEGLYTSGQWQLVL